MTRTALVLGDQLSPDNPALDGADRVLVVESRAALARLPYHRQRRHLVLSAMRRFAAELRERGIEVDERRGAGTLGEILREGGHGEVVCAEPNSAPSRRALARLGVSFVPSTQFLTRPEAFGRWADGRRRVVMEDFYRDQRRRFGLLVDDDGEPEGGRWNFDADNRRPGHAALRAPAPWTPIEDEVDAEVRADLDAMGLEEYGEDGPRLLPATRAEAEASLEDFLAHRLAEFGPWEDAMVTGDRVLFHSRLSAAMNLWLVDPLAVVRRVEEEYRAGRVPLQSAEGYVRQVVGWREYVWGMYWWRVDEWPRDNALDARAELPRAWWTGETEANCLRTVVREVREDAWTHHINRLMVLGNLMLLLGVEPWAGVEWFQLAFVDGAEWVMAPNAAGMALHADGGVMFTKPYAGGGNYIDRMSDYCAGCRYSPRERTGPRACPVTALYWDFIGRHETRWASNRRMRGPLRTWARMDAAERAAIRSRAEEAREELRAG